MAGLSQGCDVCRRYQCSPIYGHSPWLWTCPSCLFVGYVPGYDYPECRATPAEWLLLAYLVALSELEE